MEEITLEVQVRQETGRRKVKPMREEGFVPAIVYGGKRKPTSIKVDRRQYEKIMRTHRGQSVVFHLNVHEGDKKLRDYAAIVRDEQRHPVQEDLIHLDFQRISLKQELEVSVPIVCLGEAVGVKKDGGSLDQPLYEIDVVCLPANIPEKIEVDISTLEIGSALHVGEIALPENVKTKLDPDTIIASVVPPMKGEEEIVAEGEAITEPEVTKEKKDKEEPKAE